MAYRVVSGTPDFWNVTFDVYPTVRGVTTDVMLVQACWSLFHGPRRAARPAESGPWP
jgi:hypothetical protein